MWFKSPGLLHPRASGNSLPGRDRQVTSRRLPSIRLLRSFVARPEAQGVGWRGVVEEPWSPPPPVQVVSSSDFHVQWPLQVRADFVSRAFFACLANVDLKKWPHGSVDPRATLRSSFCLLFPALKARADFYSALVHSLSLAIV